MRAAKVEAARCILVAVPDAFEGGQIVAQARERNASLLIVARAHSEAEIEHLMKHGATSVVMGEHEIAKAMLAAIPPAAPPAGSPTPEPSPPVAPA
jgi:CPA2 family monovalent cation:H+ antiporter-2